MARLGLIRTLGCMAQSTGTTDAQPAESPDEDPRPAIDRALYDFLARQHEVLLGVAPELEVVAALAEAYLRGGKRLRPVFCYWGWRAAGADPEPALIRAAASLELLQACALIHDDVMDDSDTRRGKPSGHKHFEAHHRDQGWVGDPRAFGRGAALLLGDLFLSWSDQLLTGSLLPPAVLARARPLIGVMRTELMAGQYLDLVVQSQRQPRPDTIAAVLAYKSAKYTIERPLQLGAQLAGGDDALVAGLGAFGLPLGEAFQLRDDLLGVFGDPAVTGKPAGDDLREGKRTLLMAEAFAAADDGQRDLLWAALGNAELDEAGVAAVRAVLLDTGAVGAVERQIDSRLSGSLAALAALDIPPAARRALTGLASAAVNRVR